MLEKDVEELMEEGRWNKARLGNYFLYDVADLFLVGWGGEEG